MSPDRNQDLPRAISYLSVAACGVLATLVFLILPIMVAGIAEQFGWNDRQLGWLAAADMGGSAIASLLVAGVIARLNGKKAIRIAIGFVMAGNLLSIFADSLGTLLLVRAVTGFSNGIIMSIVFAKLCHSDNPDRYFGAYAFLQLGMQAILLPLLPKAIALWSMEFVYVFLAVMSLASMSLLRWFPASSNPGNVTPAASQALVYRPPEHFRARWGMLALLAQAIYFLAPAAIWAYFGVIGRAFGLSLGQTGNALGVATLAGMAGGLLVVILANRFGRSSSMAVGTLISLLSVWLLLNGSGLYGFFLAAVLLNFSWNFTFPYQMGILALFDRKGSLAVLGLVVQTFGLSVGPIMASLLLTGDDFSRMLWFCGACYGLSLLVFLYCYRGGSRHLTEPGRALA